MLTFSFIFVNCFIISYLYCLSLIFQSLALLSCFLNTDMYGKNDNDVVLLLIVERAHIFFFTFLLFF